MKTLIKPKNKDQSIARLDYKNKALMIVFVFMISLCVLFAGGALSVTIQYDEFALNSWTGGISWMWIPALLFFGLSYSKKGEIKSL